MGQESKAATARRGLEPFRDSIKLAALWRLRDETTADGEAEDEPED